jgi:hypothetical protein
MTASVRDACRARGGGRKPAIGWTLAREISPQALWQMPLQLPPRFSAAFTSADSLVRNSALPQRIAAAEPIDLDRDVRQFVVLARAPG